MRARFDQPLSQRSIARILVAAAGLLAAMLLTFQMPSARELGRYADRLPGAEQVKNLTALFDARSPGKRTEGKLTTSKRARAHFKIAHGPDTPKTDKTSNRQQTLREAAPSADEQLARSDLLLALGALELAGPLDLPEPETVADVGASGDLVLGVVGAPGGGLVAPGGFGGGGGGPGVGSSGDALVTPVSPSVAAVPEPATWAMMLIGFGLIGAGMRRRRPGSSEAMAWSGR